MNPACPIENWPVKPLTIVRETARTTLTPIVIRTFAQNAPMAGTTSRWRTSARPSPTATGARLKSAAPAALGADSSAEALMLHLLRDRGSEDSAGPHEEHEDQQREDVDVAQARGDVGA